MKIRHKITIGIAGTALIASLSLASFIFFELIEEPLKIIDKELAFVADSIFAQGPGENLNSSGEWQIDATMLPHSPDHYWIKVCDHHEKTLYQSHLTKFTDIPKNPENHSHYNVEQMIPKDQIDIGQDDLDEVVFRVRVLHRQINGMPVTMHIAKPIEELEEELLVVMKEALVGVLICVCFVVLISYYLAGKILQPIATMTELSRRISEDSLDQRIPVGENRDELASLAKGLNRMLDGLQYSFTRQRAFISNGSHELKTPLTHLLLSQEVLLQYSALPPQMRDDLERQYATMGRMKKLVQNLLTLSSLEHQNTLSLESLNLSLLITEVVDQYQEMFAATAIQVSVDVKAGVNVLGDRLKLQRLFINLIDNAIQYNDPKHGVLTITSGTKDGLCIIDIDNAGARISAAEQSLIFEQFYRVEKSRSTSHGGVGLGLTMCKKIVELHGGRIQVRSGFLGGTQFRIILPC